MPTRTISPGQFATLIVAAYLGAGIFQFPRQLVASGGLDAVYAFALECLGAYGGLWLWFRVNRLQPDQQVSGFSRRYVGPWLAYPLLAFTVVLHIVLAVLALANFGWVMVTFFLPDTPAWAIRTAVLLVALYMAWFDTPVLGRTLQTVVLPAMLASIVMGILLLDRMSYAYALLPTLHPAWRPLLVAAYRGSYIFWGYEVTVTLYPFVRSADRRRAERLALCSMAGTFLFLLFGYTLTVGVDGPAMVALTPWPAVSAMRLIDVSGFIINKLGLLVVVFWGLFVLAFSGIRLWCVAHDVMPPFGLSGVARYRLLLLGTGAVVFGLSFGFSSVVAVVTFSERWMVPAMIGYNFGLPPLLLLAAAIRGVLAGRGWLKPA